MFLRKLLIHELSAVLIVKFILLYFLWLAFFSSPNPKDDKQNIVQHIFGTNQPVSKSQHIKE